MSHSEAEISVSHSTKSNLNCFVQISNNVRSMGVFHSKTHKLPVCIAPNATTHDLYVFMRFLHAHMCVNPEPTTTIRSRQLKIRQNWHQNVLLIAAEVNRARSPIEWGAVALPIDSTQSSCMLSLGSAH